MSEPAPELEILVHISAPSKVADDAVYRSYGQAYLAFEPRARPSLPLTSEAEVDRAAAAPPAPARPQSPSWIAESQELSFRSALDNRASPRDRPRQHAAALPVSCQATPDAPSEGQLPSEIADSYPMPSASLLHESPTRILQTFLRSTAYAREHVGATDNGAHPEIRAVPEVTSSFPDPSLGREANLQDLTAVDPADERSSRAAASTSASKLMRDDSCQRETRHPGMDLDHVLPHDVTHISNSAVSLNAPGPSSKEDVHLATPHLRPTQVPTSSDAPVVTPSTPALSSELLSALEIHSPSPPPGLANLDPSCFVTPKLATLAGQLSSRYRPLPSSRHVDPLERGYWLVNCEKWPAETRSAAWAFLTRYISRGDAGWGIWCLRSQTTDSIRLYCWGCIVEHAYLLLYLASGRKMKATGASWIDAEGEAAVKVGPRMRP